MWKRIRSHVSPKDEKPAFLSPSATHPSRRSSSITAVPQRGRTSASNDLLESDRSTRGPSPFSTYRGQSPAIEEGSSDELGLHVLYNPPSPALLDIIFVHGLGGASHKTWSKYQDNDLFWPQQWLPYEPGISTARILTFGYNASFRSGGPQNTNISDFAKDLLFGMKFGSDGNTEELKIGDVPIIFIVHSMGGLVVKKAYLLGQNDENYYHIVKSISSIIFLATPHRGTNLAELLNRLLFVSFQSPKDFVVDLTKSSTALEDINEQFRHIAPKLSIFSFYETLPTYVGPKKMMILEKESSILGYPGEISKSLNADHHDVCKYTSQEDSNYISVRNALKNLVRRIGSRVPENDALESQIRDDVHADEQLLASLRTLEDDLDFFRRRWMPGTCEWILSEPAFKVWLEDAPGSRVTWLTAPPASGKSILSAYIISHLRNKGQHCQYFFFKHADHTRCSLKALLKSIGLQMARHIPAFRQEMAKLSREGATLEKKDARFTWQKIFVSILSQIALQKPLYWIIDGLDESESPKALLELLQSLSTLRTSIRVFVLSRETEALSLAFDKLSGLIPVSITQKFDQTDATADIRMYVENELRSMRGTEELKLQVMESVIDRAEGNFLWTHLVLEEISRCHTPQAIELILKEIPAGMIPLYERMELAIANNLSKADHILARTLLTWIVCARRPLTLKELSQALTPEFPEFLDLGRTIQDVCGQFVVVDRSSRVAIVHTTARDFLTRTPHLQFFVNEEDSHRALFLKSISFLLRPELRSKLGRNQQAICATEPFLLYAATSFMYHLRKAASTSEDMMEKLATFLKGASVLTWVHSLALFSQLEVLVISAQVLTWFGGLNRKLNLEKNPLLHRVRDLELFELWAIDLVKIVAKFGRHLLDDPTAIHDIIPPLCPHDSITFQQFSQIENSSLSISGVSNTVWDDCLARLSLRDGAKAWKITCAGRHIAVLSSTGSIILWDSVNFEETCTMHHAEFVTDICFNGKCDALATYGFKTTKIWAIPSGQLVAEIANPAGSKALTITFVENDTKVLIGSDDRIIRHLHMKAVEKGWHSQDPALLQENTPIDGGFITSPSSMAFNADASKIAVAYRGYPLSIWATNEPRLIRRCRRAAEYRPDHARARPSVSWMAVDRVVWSPVADVLVGLYKDGSVFKWDPIDDKCQEAHTIADEIQVSPDGKLFVTSDSNGTVKIWNLDYFSVIYQLASENLVTDLAFSPDCKRFYDLRGSSINAWEPNSLIRFSDDGETFSDTTSDYQISTSISHISEACVASIDPINALAAARASMLYCASYENGTVSLFDKSKGKILDLFSFSAFLTTEHLVWGEDGRHIAAADLGGNIIVKRLDPLSPDTVSAQSRIQSVLACKAKVMVGGIHQILLNRDSTMLLVVSQDSGQIWSLETGNIAFAGPLVKGETRRWIAHPLQRELLIGVGPRNLIVTRWEDLTEVACLSFEGDLARLGGQSSLGTDDATNTHISQLPSNPGSEVVKDSYVNKAMITQDSKNLLLQISQVSRLGASTKRLLIFPLSQLQRSDYTNSPTSVDPFDISIEVTAKIEVPLGILPGETLVFLDKDLWMCTLKMDSSRQLRNLKRHYFITRDWAGAESLEQCCMLDDGTLLWPKDGEVAVISSSLGEARW